MAVPVGVVDAKLYAAVVDEARARYARFPSAYASAWIAKTYRQRGGRYSGKRTAGVTTWMREQWIQVVPYLTRGEVITCGAPGNGGKACRPLRRVTARTPPTIGELLDLHGEEVLLKLARAKNRNMDARVDWKRATITRPA